MPIDYGNGKIYTIRKKGSDVFVYVGCTCSPLSKRFYEHKQDDTVDGKKVFLNEFVGGSWNTWYIELHELYPCKSREELTQRAGQVEREISTMNIHIERLSFTKIDNLVYDLNALNGNNRDAKALATSKIYGKAYYDKNQDKLKERNKEYRQRKKTEKEQNQAMAIFLTEIQ